MPFYFPAPGRLISTASAVVVLFLLCSSSLSAQTPSDNTLDSLANRVQQYITSDADSAYFFTQKGLELARNSDSTEQLIGFLNYEAYLLSQKENIQQAEQSGKEAVKLSTQIKNNRRLAQSLVTLGNVYKEEGLYKEAIEKFVKALEIAENNFIHDQTGRAAYSIAAIYMNRQNLDEGLKYMQMALSAYQKNNETQRIAAAYMAIGGIYYYRKDYDSAAHYLEKCMSLDGTSLMTQANVSSNLGELYARQKKYGKSIEAQRKAYQLNQKLGYRSYIVSSSMLLGRVFAKSNQPDSARHYLTEALYVATPDSLFIEQLPALYQTLFTLDSTQKNYQKAMIWANEYAKARTKLQARQNDKSLKEVTTKYETEKKELQNEKLRQENQILEQQQKIEAGIRTGLMGGVLALLLVVGLVWNVARLRKTKISQQEQIISYERVQAEERKALSEAKETARQAEKQVLQQQAEEGRKRLIHQEMMLATQHKKLLDYKDHLNKSFADKDALIMPQSVKAVIRDIEQYTNPDRNWQLFVKGFEELFPGWLERLEEQYPKLSRAETRSCAYFRLGQNNQEVADAMNIHIKSVFRNRQRIKDKLNLESADQIEVALEEL